MLLGQVNDNRSTDLHESQCPRCNKVFQRKSRALLHESKCSKRRASFDRKPSISEQISNSPATQSPSTVQGPKNTTVDDTPPAKIPRMGTGSSTASVSEILFPSGSNRQTRLSVANSSWEDIRNSGDLPKQDPDTFEEAVKAGGFAFLYEWHQDPQYIAAYRQHWHEIRTRVLFTEVSQQWHFRLEDGEPDIEQLRTRLTQVYNFQVPGYFSVENVRNKLSVDVFFVFFVENNCENSTCFWCSIAFEKIWACRIFLRLSQQLVFFTRPCVAAITR